MQVGKGYPRDVEPSTTRHRSTGVIPKVGENTTDREKFTNQL
jgi:hypothetical protein